MQEKLYPNHTMMISEMKKLDVAGTYNISRKTILPNVAYLKEELHNPIEYDPVNWRLLSFDSILGRGLSRLI